MHQVQGIASVTMSLMMFVPMHWLCCLNLLNFTAGSVPFEVSTSCIFICLRQVLEAKPQLATYTAFTTGWNCLHYAAGEQTFTVDAASQAFHRLG